MFPLSTVLFPHGTLPLHVFEPRYRVLMDHCLAAEREFGVVMIERGSEVGGGDLRSGTGTLARIEVAQQLPDGRWLMAARGVEPIRVLDWLPDDPYPVATVVPISEPELAPEHRLLAEARSWVRRARALLSELGDHPPMAPDAPGTTTEQMWHLCAAAPLGPLDRQRLLVAGGPEARLEALVELCRAAAEDMGRLLGGASGPSPEP
ncbi:MAG TPA: LON peptidase substrate-binding domain-containing protein [Acidimicrobiales bacterium]|jgi:Lon protease-like protein